MRAAFAIGALVAVVVLATAVSAAPAAVVYDLGGDFQRHGFGRNGFALGGGNVHTSRVSIDLSRGYGIGFSQAQIGWSDAAATTELRMLAPTGQPRYGYTWYGGVPWDVLVRVPRCTRVTFYAYDKDSHSRRQTVTQLSSNGAALSTATIDRDFHDGVYVSFVQTEWRNSYRFTRVAGANAVAAGIFFDPANPAECGGAVVDYQRTTYTHFANISGTRVTAAYGGGGDFAALGYGGSAWMLPPQVRTPSTESGIEIAMASSSYSIGWAPVNTPVNAADFRLLKPTNGARQGFCWYANHRVGVRVTVPSCARVTLYLLDYDSEARRLTVRVTASGRTNAYAVPGSLNEGAYVSFVQSDAAVNYEAVKQTSGTVNVPISGVMVDLLSDSHCPGGFNADAVSPPMSPPDAAAGTSSGDSGDSDSDSDVPVGAIIGAVLGVVALVVIAFFIGRCAAKSSPPPEAQQGNTANTVVHAQPAVLQPVELQGQALPRGYGEAVVVGMVVDGSGTAANK